MSEKSEPPNHLVVIEIVRSIYESGIKQVYIKYDDLDKRVQYLEKAINILVEKLADDER